MRFPLLMSLKVTLIPCGAQIRFCWGAWPWDPALALTSGVTLHRLSTSWYLSVLNEKVKTIICDWGDSPFRSHSVAHKCKYPGEYANVSPWLVESFSHIFPQQSSLEHTSYLERREHSQNLPEADILQVGCPSQPIPNFLILPWVAIFPG